MRSKIKSIGIGIILIGILNYFMLPPWNWSDPQFWRFWLIVLIGGSILISWNQFSLFRTLVYQKHAKYLFSSLLVIITLIIIINLINTPIFRAKMYYRRIKVTNGNFKHDVHPLDYNQIALLDKDSSRKLGDKVMGQMTDLVSQFEVSNLYTQINYNNQLVRVTPLEYANVIKYFTNRRNGIKAYIKVNSGNGETELIKLKKGMRYMPSALFFENLTRYLRFKYPFTIFGKINFEIDDQANPYWIIETVRYTGIGLKKEISGIIILNPIEGTSHKYQINEIPKWVDHVYDTKLIIEQLNDWGSYRNGFLNSIFGQKKVMKTTAGYNYIALNDDIYMYTGITSVASDAANVGFILTNLRTKETRFYNVAGTDEKSAMASAEGQVQQMKYVSTFPLLINLADKPTYLVSLKDNAGLVKMYALIDYENYQQVVVTDAAQGIKVAVENYLGQVRGGPEIQTKEIIVETIKNAVINHNTYYYIKTESEVYKVPIKINETVLPFVTKGTKLKIKFTPKKVNEIIEIEILKDN